MTETEKSRYSPLSLHPRSSPLSTPAQGVTSPKECHLNPEAQWSKISPPSNLDDLKASDIYLEKL